MNVDEGDELAEALLARESRLLSSSLDGLRPPPPKLMLSSMSLPPLPLRRHLGGGASMSRALVERFDLNISC